MLNPSMVGVPSANVIVQELLNRIASHLNTQRKTIEEAFSGVVAQNHGGKVAY